MDRVWYETQVTRYAPLFEDGDTNTLIYHIETNGVIQTIESEVMRACLNQLGKNAQPNSNECSM